MQMIFNNAGYIPQQRNLGISQSQTPNVVVNAPVKNMSINGAMIDRVHKAKPGCSACGKKVA